MPARKGQKHDSEAVRLEAARLLATGLNCCEVAEKVGVGVKAIYNWKKKPEFRELVEDIQQDIHQAAIGRIISRQSQIIDSLFDKVSIEIDPERMNHSDQVNASKILLGLSERAIEAAQSRRIKRLEELLAEVTGDAPNQ